MKLNNLKFHFSSKIDDAREIYERLVSVFPTCGRYWKVYIEQEVSSSGIEKYIMKIFYLDLILGIDHDQVRKYF